MHKVITYSESFVRSALTRENKFNDLGSVRAWLRELQANPDYKVKQIKFDQLDGWYLEDTSSNIKHQSGKFFTIEGIRCNPASGSSGQWQQPIIYQREVGILGIITKLFAGVRYFLMQAKMEPGNVNHVQLSPTLQATYSNYTRVHKGKSPPYLEYFLDPSKAIVISDQHQSETGTRFFQKFNRNILLDVSEDIELIEGFRWLTLADLQELMSEDDIVNMDARSVLSNINFGYSAQGLRLLGERDAFRSNSFVQSALSSVEQAKHSFDKLSHWLKGCQKKLKIDIKNIPLSEVSEWELDDWGVSNPVRNYFSVCAVAVEAGEREVPSWTQPILKHHGIGLAGFVSQKINGVLHFLIQAKPEPGIVNTVELGPTVSVFDYENRLDLLGVIPFFGQFLNPDKTMIRYSAIHSEEGGRFWNLRNRFLVIEVPATDKVEISDRFNWLTLAQLHQFTQVDNLVNSEARTLLACLKFNGAQGTDSI